MKVLNFGSLNLDYVYRVDHMVTPGETLACAGMETFLGGKGFNQSVALARAGVPVFHAGLIGEDGGAFLTACGANGIDARYIREAPGCTGHTIIQVDRSGQNCILLHGGSNRLLERSYVDEVLSDFSPGDLLILQNEINLLDYIINRAWSRGMRIVLNPSPFNRALDDCDMGKVAYLLLNEVEGEQLSHESEPEQILSGILEQYPEMKVVLTLGAQGAVYGEKALRCRQSACKAGPVVDTTAAGDTFTGYFVAGVLEDMPIQENLARCVLASGIAITRQGAVPSIPTREEVERFRLNGKTS